MRDPLPLAARLGVVFVALGLLACQAAEPAATPTVPPQTAGTPTPGAPTPASPGIPPDQTEIVYLGFGGSEGELYENVIIPSFREQTGVSVTQVFGGSLDHLATLQAQRDNPEADVAGASGVSLAAGRRDGLFAPLDPALVPNLDEIYPLARFDDDVGLVNTFAVIGIQYNTDVFEQNGWEPPTSWMDLADPRYQGHVYGVDCSHSFMLQTILLLADAFGSDQRDLDAAAEVLRQIAPNVGALVGAPAEVESLYAQGEAWIGWSTTARTFPQREQGVATDFVYPTDGAGLHEEPVAVVDGAPNPEAAQAFVNHLLSFETQQALTEQTPGRATVRADVYEAVAPDIQAMIPGPEQIESGAIKRMDFEFINDELDTIVTTCQEALSQ